MADGHGVELFDRLKSLGLPVGDYAVFGSAPLLVRGIIDSVGDLDVICRGTAWSQACEIGTSIDYAGVTLVSIDDGAITFGTTWGYGSFDIDELIDSSECIDGIPFVTLDHVLSYKRAAGRPKDLAHMALINRYLDETSRNAGRS